MSFQMEEARKDRWMQLGFGFITGVAASLVASGIAGLLRTRKLGLNTDS